jgi:predicted Rdx family selenoprotein
LGLVATIRPGPRGAFIVNADGHAIAEKTGDGFPEEAAVVAKLKALA